MFGTTAASAALALAPPASSALPSARRTKLSSVARATRTKIRRCVVARATNDFTVPDNFVGVGDAASGRAQVRADGAVTYTMRFYTGSKMGNGMNAPDAGVQVMLIAADGRAFMQRVDRYPDIAPDLALYSAPRFERGNIDEVSFDAPDLGLPVALWIAPESGGEWYLEEVEVSCSEGSVMAAEAALEGKTSVVSYPCMERLGAAGAEALELRPSAFVKMTSEQRAEMRAQGLKEYGELKTRMLTATGAAVLLGCAVTAAVSRSSGSGDLEAMRSFASGGGVALVYLWMLTRSVDVIGGGVVKSQPDEEYSIFAAAADALVGAASSGPARLLLLGSAGAAFSRHVGVDAMHMGDALAALLGFLTYKAGVLVAGFSGTDVTLGEAAYAPVPVEQTRRDDRFDARL